MADFVRVGYLNAEKFFNDGKLAKGTLVKYRVMTHTMVTYTHSTLDPSDYYWKYGIVSEVLWYAATPRVPNILTGEERMPIVYDLVVHSTQDNKKDYIDFHNFEVQILVE